MAVFGSEWSQAYILVGIGAVILARCCQVAYNGAAEYIAYKAMALAVPGVEDGAGGTLAVEFGKLESLTGAGGQFGLAHSARPKNADKFHRVVGRHAEVQFAGMGLAADLAFL